MKSKDKISLTWKTKEGGEKTTGTEHNYKKNEENKANFFFKLIQERNIGR